MNRVFVIADTHFGHRKVTEFRPFATVEEHDRELVARWNATVNKADTVWHLGDVCLGGKGNVEIIGSLNGIKKLVLGNHDVYQLDLYRAHFSKIFGAAEWHDCILTHVPVHPYQLDNRYRLNVHGHMHSATISGDSRYRCVSAEQTDYRPKLMREVIGSTGGSVGLSAETASSPNVKDGCPNPERSQEQTGVEGSK